MLSAALAAAGALASVGCAGLDDQQEAQLSVHQQNSQDFFQRGAYAQALHQADMALTLDDDLWGMRLIKGFCLTKIGKLADRPQQLDEAVELFEELVDSDGGQDFRIWIGAGQAHLARALTFDEDIARIQRRLDSDFLSPQGRLEEERNLEDARIERVHHLTRAEELLRHVFEFPNQRDNPTLVLELTLVLNSIGGREDEAVTLAHQAVDQLRESTRLTRNTLQKSLSLEPTGQLTLQRRIDENLEKERMLRDIVVTIEYNRGAYQACLQEYAALEERQLITQLDYLNRAGIYETVGMLDEAIADLETFLRQRARDSEYDDTAAEVFDRIDKLRDAATASR